MIPSTTRTRTASANWPRCSRALRRDEDGDALRASGDDLGAAARLRREVRGCAAGREPARSGDDPHLPALAGRERDPVGADLDVARAGTEGQRDNHRRAGPVLERDGVGEHDPAVRGAAREERVLGERGDVQERARRHDAHEQRDAGERRRAEREDRGPERATRTAAARRGSSR